MSNYIESSSEPTSKSGSGLGAILFFVVVVLAAASGGHGRAVNSSAASTTSSSALVSQIYATFGWYGAQAVRVAQCESSMNPAALNTTTPVLVNGLPEEAQGLFQILPSTFASVSTGSEMNASDNIQAAYRIFVRDHYSWREWACKP